VDCIHLALSYRVRNVMELSASQEELWAVEVVMHILFFAALPKCLFLLHIFETLTG
jgi:hypothetical protein